MADNGPMVHSPPPGWGMLPMIYRGGKGDFTEGGVRTPAFAWWPGVIEDGQIVDEYRACHGPVHNVCPAAWRHEVYSDGSHR